LQAGGRANFSTGPLSIPHLKETKKNLDDDGVPCPDNVRFRLKLVQECMPVSDKAAYLAAICWGAITKAIDAMGQTANTNALDKVAQIMNFDSMKNVARMNVNLFKGSSYSTRFCSFGKWILTVNNQLSRSLFSFTESPLLDAFFTIQL
jgi:hypothetical protein